MRIAESITLPGDLERARSAGELVVFAGAGVSMGPPANLPGFKELARRIAEPRVLLGNRSDLDRYLSEAERAGVLVQERARAVLRNGGTHTPLHEHLLGIFGTVERVRLITTNFDSHFTSAALRVFPGRTVPHYIGPALPPGTRFSGIAHLHGSLTSTQDRLVLTAADFADAYMAEGWAARFLVKVFADRTVMFVGYSVSDPIIQYLLQALPPTGRWFALWHDSETPPPEYAIAPVTFSTSASGDRYGDLLDGFQRWHWYSTAPPSDHDHQLRRLIAEGPPASALDGDYIRVRLATEAGRNVFFTNARDERWFDWVAEQGLLDCITEQGCEWTLTGLWSRWCLYNFCSGDNPALLKFLRTRPLSLHPVFLAELRRLLATLDALPPDPVLRQLIALIATEPQIAGATRHDWQWLIDRMVLAGCFQEAVALLRAGTRLRLSPREHLYGAFQDDEEHELPPLAVRVRTFVPPSELNAVIKKNGEILAMADATGLSLLGEERLLEAYELLDLARGSTRSIDWLSYGRTAIEESNQDRNPHAEDVLILLIRVAIDHWSRSSPALARAFADRHSRNQRNIFKRLALYAYAKCSDCPSDAVLDMAIQERWAQNLWVRPEMYLLLTAHYSRVSEETRQRFIKSLRDDRTWGDEFDKHNAHARFSLAHKLLRDAPDSEVTQALARAESEAHAEWEEADRDGYLSRIDIAWSHGDEPSPIEAAEMLAWEASEAVGKIGQALREVEGSSQWHSILGAVQQAVKASPSWGAELYSAAIGSDEMGFRVAEAVLWALRDIEPDQSTQLRVVRKAIVSPLPTLLLLPLGMVVEKWADAVRKGANESLLNALDAVADRLFDAAKDFAPGIEDGGWTERAINHPAGQAAQAWWSIANARDWVDDQFVLTVDHRERERWEKTIGDDTASGMYARPILGMATDRFSAGDAPWADRAIFPYFDPARGSNRAAQLWDGRLMQRHWSWTTVAALSPYFASLFDESSRLVPERGHELGEWVAFLLANRDKSRLTLLLVHQFIQSASEEARVAFASGLPRQIEVLEPKDRLQLWRDLLRPYWSDRRTNMPVQLSLAEIREMLMWIVAIPEAANEVLTELLATPGENIEHADDLIWRWKEGHDSWIFAHPTEAAGIVGFLAQRWSLNAWVLEDAVQVLERALEAGAAKESYWRQRKRSSRLRPHPRPHSLREFAERPVNERAVGTHMSSRPRFAEGR